MSEQKKHGLLVVPFMSGKGGTERVIQNLFESLQNDQSRNFDLTVLSVGGSDNYDWSKKIPITIKHVGATRKMRTLAYLTVLPFIIFHFIRQRQFDFIISTNPIMWYLAKLSCRFLHRKTKVISWYHYSLKQKPIKSIFLKGADHYLAISSGIVDQLVSYGIRRDKISLIYNPIPDSDRIVKRPVEACKFVYIGRIMLDGQKNLRELLLALKNMQGNWTLELYGDTQEAGPVKTFARQLKIEQKLIWHGFVEDPWKKINDGTALILTSKYEGLPMVLCEAVAHGLFVVSSNIDTGPADIINSNNGLLYASGNTDQLTQILQWLVDSPQLPDHKVIKQTSQKFQIETYRDNFSNAINKALNE